MDTLSEASGHLAPNPTPLAAEAVVRELAYLPSAPRVLPRLKQLLADPNSPMRDIVMLVKLDPGLVARVLQVANSVYYNKSGVRCLAVEEAVTRVGFDQIYEMVSYAVASQVLARPLVVYGIEADELWRMSVAAALAGELIAGLAGGDRCVAYTTGLLHGVGMVAIEEWAMHHRSSLVLSSRGLPLEYVASERQALGFTQADAGAAMLEHWGFPPEMVLPVRWQYAPLAAEGYAREAATLHLAKWVRNLACDEGAAPLLPAPPLFNFLRLTGPQLVRIAGEVRLKMVALRHLLELQ